MKSPILIFIFLLLGFSSAFVVAEEKYERGVLWKIEYKNTAPSYLFGTIHVDDESVTALPQVVSEAFNQAETFAVEAINDKASTRKFLASMFFADPELPALLGEDAYRQVDNLLARRNIPETIRPRYKPWAAMLALQQPQKRGTIVLDQLMLRNAAQHKKTIIPLETIEEQIAAFNDMSQATQLALLQHVQSNHEKIQSLMADMIDAYLNRDLARLMQLSRMAFPGGKVSAVQEQEFLSRILYSRNKVMADRLSPLLQKGNVFAACGALHLYGEQGMLKLLAQQGYKISKVY
jgi:uncharacterized protein